MPRKGSWSMKDHAYAIKLRHQHVQLREIAKILDRTYSSVRSKLEAHPSERVTRGEKVRKCPIAIPLTVTEEQILRGSLAPRDLTAALLGDPLPGFSALDRKRAA